MQRWYVASTHPKAEAFAAAELKNQDFETYLPLKDERKIVRHKAVSVTSPLFPSYLFVCFDRTAQRWRSINGTRGVQRLICSGLGDNPRPLPIGAVEDLQARQAAGEFGAREDRKRPIILAGQMLRILSGPFSDFEGICLLSKGQRVTVLISMLGRSSPTELRSDQVIAA